MSTVRFSFSMTSTPKNERLPLPRATSIKRAHGHTGTKRPQQPTTRGDGLQLAAHVLAYFHVHLRGQVALRETCSTEKLRTRVNSLPLLMPCYEHEYDTAVLTSDCPERCARF